MHTRHNAYLSEMGIEQWQLIHPERLLGIQHAKQNIDSHFSVLLVCDEQLAEREIEFVQKVLQSFGASLDETLTTQPHQLSQLGEHLLTWVWFVDCATQQTDIAKVLHSSSLVELMSNPVAKKQLWQQIVALKES